MIYDRFGRPQPEGHVEPPTHGQPPMPQHERIEPAPAPPRETYDPNAGTEGSWSEPTPAPAERVGGGRQRVAAGRRPNRRRPDGSEGSWGEPSPDAGGGGDWGSPESAASGR